MRKTIYRVIFLSFVVIMTTVLYGRVFPGDLEWAETGKRVWFTMGGILLMAAAEWLNIGRWIREDE